MQRVASSSYMLTLYFNFTLRKNIKQSVTYSKHKKISNCTTQGSDGAGHFKFFIYHVAGDRDYNLKLKQPLPDYHASIYQYQKYYITGLSFPNFAVLLTKVYYYHKKMPENFYINTTRILTYFLNFYINTTHIILLSFHSVFSSPQNGTETINYLSDDN